MQASGTVQMNTRIDGQLKAAGDQVLSLFGYSPTQAIRALWEYLVAHQDQPENIARILNPDAASEERDHIRERLDALARGRSLCAARGPVGADLAATPYEQIRDSAYASRYNQEA